MSSKRFTRDISRDAAEWNTIMHDQTTDRLVIVVKKKKSKRGKLSTNVEIWGNFYAFDKTEWVKLFGSIKEAIAEALLLL